MFGPLKCSHAEGAHRGLRCSGASLKGCGRGKMPSWSRFTLPSRVAPASAVFDREGKVQPARQETSLHLPPFLLKACPLSPPACSCPARPPPPAGRRRRRPVRQAPASARQRARRSRLHVGAVRWWGVQDKSLHGFESVFQRAAALLRHVRMYPTAHCKPSQFDQLRKQ